MKQMASSNEVDLVNTESEMYRLQNIVQQMETQKTADESTYNETSISNQMEVSEIEGCFFIGTDVEETVTNKSISPECIQSETFYLKDKNHSDPDIIGLSLEELINDNQLPEDPSWLMTIEDTFPDQVKEKDVVDWLRTCFREDEIIPVKHQLVLRLTEIEIINRRESNNGLYSTDQNSQSSSRRLPVPQPVIRAPMVSGMPTLRRPTSLQPRRILPPTPVHLEAVTMESEVVPEKAGSKSRPPDCDFGSDYSLTNSNSSSDKELNRTYSKEELSKLLASGGEPEMDQIVTPPTTTGNSKIRSHLTPRVLTKGPLKTPTSIGVRSLQSTTPRETTKNLPSKLPNRNTPSKLSPPQKQKSASTKIGGNDSSLRSRFGFSMARLPASGSSIGPRKFSVPVISQSVRSTSAQRPMTASSPGTMTEHQQRPVTAGIPRLRPPRSGSVGSLAAQSQRGKATPVSPRNGRSLRVPSSPVRPRRTAAAVHQTKTTELVV